MQVTHTLGATDTIDASKLNTNFDDIEAILNGGLKTGHIHPQAGIVADQIADRWAISKRTIQLIGRQSDNSGSSNDISSSVEVVCPSSLTRFHYEEIIASDGQPGFLYCVQWWAEAVTSPSGGYPAVDLRINGATVGGTVTLDTSNNIYRINADNPVQNPMVAIADGDSLELRVGLTSGSTATCGMLNATIFEIWQMVS